MICVNSKNPAAFKSGNKGEVPFFTRISQWFLLGETLHFVIWGKYSRKRGSPFNRRPPIHWARFKFDLWLWNCFYKSLPHASHLSLPDFILNLQWGQGSSSIFVLAPFRSRSGCHPFFKFWWPGKSGGEANLLLPKSAGTNRNFQFIMTPAKRLANPIAINNDPHSMISRGPRGFQNKITPSPAIKNAETRRKNQPTATRPIPVSTHSHGAG